MDLTKTHRTFMTILKKLIIKQGNVDVISVGDWNLLLNQEKDAKNYKHANNPKSRLKVLEIMNELNLYDIWREENTDTFQFTWKRRFQNRVIQRGRLDFFLISEPLNLIARNVKILPGYRSDHSIVSMSLIFGEKQKKKTFWKFNNSLLSNPDYVNKVKETILNIKKQYAATPYNIDNISSIDNEIFQSVLNDQLFFDILLLEIRNTTLSFSSNLNKLTNQEEKN